MMEMVVEGFDWDKGNRGKCTKHGVSAVQVESIFRGRAFTGADARHSHSEDRQWAVGKTDEGRWVFVVFTIRERSGKKVIRPISARYMHRKEVKRYEKENPDI
jgi:uncharacterized DUF497 family protein